MGVCWQTTGDNSSRIKSSSRLTNSIIVAAQPNSTGTNIHHQELNEQKNNNEKKMENAPIFDSSFEESVKNYPDMPEIEPKIMKGYGIKQMPGYKCDLKIDQLNKKRDEFWASKNKLNIYKWKIIHQACIYDHINAEEFLYKNNMKTIEGCINLCSDNQGNVFRVPNYCINDPYFQLELLDKEKAEGEEIEIRLFDVVNQKQNKLNVLDNITGEELIEKYANEENIDLSKNKIRLLFGGGIIKENETLYQHKVKNGYSIQICISPL